LHQLNHVGARIGVIGRGDKLGSVGLDVLQTIAPDIGAVGVDGTGVGGAMVGIGDRHAAVNAAHATAGIHHRNTPPLRLVLIGTSPLKSLWPTPISLCIALMRYSKRPSAALTI
jgi:hypothetical protein